jgi:hypothetical protein
MASTWSEQGGRDDSDAIRTAVSIGAGRDDDGVQQVRPDTVSQPPQVFDVTVAH